MIFLLLLLLAAHASACPFFCRTPRANFTTYQLAVIGCSPSYPIWVCDGAVIQAPFIPIVQNLALLGDMTTVPSAYEAVRLTVENLSPSAAAFIVSSNAEVTVMNLQISFNQTLFQVIDAGYLSVSNVNFYFGLLAVLVQTTSPGAGVGFAGQFVHFDSVGVGIMQASGPVACLACQFFQPRISPVSMINTVFLSSIRITYSNWIDNPAALVSGYINIQLSANPNAPVAPFPNFPADWGVKNANAITHSYASTCALPTASPSPSPAGFGFSAPTPLPTASSSSSGFSTTNIILLVFGALLIAIVGSIWIYSRTSARTNQSYQKVNNNSQ